MSEATKNIFRMIEEGRKLIFLLADSENYDFGNNEVYPVHICFTDSSCFPYRRETAHHKKVKCELEFMINQRQKMAYLMNCTKIKGVKCKLKNVLEHLVADENDYYAFIEIK